MAELTTAEERRPRPSDWSLTAVLGVGSAVFAALYEAAGFWPFEFPLWVLCLASLAVTLPLPFRRLHPSLVAWVISVVYVTAQFLGMMEPGVSQITLFMSVYAIGAWQSDRQAAFLSRLVLCVGIFLSLIATTVIHLSALGELTVIQYAASSGISFLINLVFFGGAWIFGDRAWNQRLTLIELRDATEEVRRQGRQLADQAIDLERVRIARELHDGVAHHIAGVGIHAAAARRSLEKNPEKARASLATIEASTRETVDELRTLVHTLRDTESTTSARRTTGNPGLGDLPELCAHARRNGQTVDVAILGTPRPLTPITELSVFRVIQESLTNCARYAGTDAEVEVRLRYGVSELEVEISDRRPAGASRAAGAGTGAGVPASDEGDSASDEVDSASVDRESAPKSQGTGLGIVGMRERMSALGGTLEAGPTTRGGWLVRASIPYPRTSGEPSDVPGAASAEEPDSASGTVSAPAPDSAKASTA